MDDLPPSIAFRLQGTKSNRDAIGAAVTIETSAGRQTRTLQAGSGFLSQHSKDIFFGLGRGERAGASVDSLAQRPGAGTSGSARSITGFGWKKDLEPSRIEPFKTAATAASPALHVEPQESRAASHERRNLAARAGCRARFFAPRFFRSSSNAFGDARQACASELLDDEVAEARSRN